jgi:hypothetical protein
MGVVLTRRQRLNAGVIAVLALATAAGWLTQAQAQNSRRTPQPAAALECPRGTVPTGTVYSEVTPNIQLALNNIAREGATLQDFTLARDSCTRELRGSNRRVNMDAYACVASAQKKIADLNRSEQNYRDAYCAQTAVAGLSGTRNAAMTAQANQTRGDILMELRTLSNPSSELGSNYLTQAIRDYTEAVRVPSAARHFALGRAYMARGNTAEANEQIRRGAAAQPADAAERQAAVRAIVQLAGADPAPSDATALLQRALELDSSSMSANAALGIRLSQSDPARAAQLFIAAINGRNDLADHPNRNYLADAHYFLAQREILSGNWGAALSSGQSALRAGGGADPKYARLVCLAYVARGWTRQTEDTTACAINTTTPQGELLNIMYHLRRAQYLNVRNASGQDVILLQTAARTQHQAEMVEIIQSYDRANVAIANWTDDQRRQALNDWPGAASIPATERDIRRMLEFGRWVLAHECPGGTRLPTYSDETFRSQGRRLYSLYNVQGCRAG